MRDRVEVTEERTTIAFRIAKLLECFKAVRCQSRRVRTAAVLSRTLDPESGNYIDKFPDLFRNLIKRNPDHIQ